jgi:hypothetical protein
MWDRQDALQSVRDSRNALLVVGASVVLFLFSQLLLSA